MEAWREETVNMVTGLHHINFIVRNLAEARPAFDVLFGDRGGVEERLPERGVKLIRYRLGPTWFVLLEPTDPDGVPGRHLAEHGEGFFLASFEVGDLGAVLNDLGARGVRAVGDSPRQGLDGWRVADLDPRAFGGVNVQLVQEGEP